MLSSNFAVALISSVVMATEPNPPTWDTSRVFVVQAGDNSAQANIDRVLAQNGGHEPAWNGQWSTGRYAFMFETGYHDLNVEIGYYTTVHGLGRSPADTQLGNLMVQNGEFTMEGGALANFWRGAENVSVTPAAGTPMLWAVSQASPLRRIKVTGDLQLYQYNCCFPGAGFASGGYMSDMDISGSVTTGSQQQWFSRNANMADSLQGVWNMVYVGCNGAPDAHCGNENYAPANTIVDIAPVVVEKPYLIKENGLYKLMRPKLEHNKVGPTVGW